MIGQKHSALANHIFAERMDIWLRPRSQIKKLCLFPYLFRYACGHSFFLEDYIKRLHFSLNSFYLL